MTKILIELILSEQVNSANCGRFDTTKRKEAMLTALIVFEKRSRTSSNNVAGFPVLLQRPGAAAEYFRFFRHGFHGTFEQEGFVRSTMVPDVVSNVECSPEATMKSWKLLGRGFRETYLTCLRELRPLLTSN
ncbi:hypothetical protein PC116_g25822 [Phytophthora cactorum]|uniref:Uncharacterized protein n=1 Tax=Phytophthora cactorum TaxID=29920 RepID=A0A8T1B5L6_9STRA|nr:hypothetical protein PC117_g23165 [Phytophthora cactorum]KAG4225762.1 hypothetical protein PC116_g25822 [Phytophthora cactorum]